MLDGELKFYPNQVRVKVTGSENFQIWTHTKLDTDMVIGNECRFPYYESLRPVPGRNEAGIFDYVLGARTPNLGYLTKSAKRKVYFLGHGLGRDSTAIGHPLYSEIEVVKMV